MSYINKIINEDSVTALRELPENSIDMVVTSPPYDNLRAYQGLIDDMKEEYNGYSFPFEQIATELSRVVKKGGVVVWVVGDAVMKGAKRVHPFDKHSILWRKGSSFTIL